MQNQPSSSAPPGRSGPRPGGRYEEREGGHGRRYSAPMRRVCPFCGKSARKLDYKDGDALRRYLTDRGKIKPRRKIGTCSLHQRALSLAIKRARHLALLPVAPVHMHV